MEEIKRSGLTLQQAKIFADAAMADVKNGFVSTGYYLKAIRDEKLWKEQGYNSFDAFLNVNYEKDKSWASRCVSLYEKFGVEISPGELPKLNPEFIDYNVSQLIEMISLPDEKRELVTPETPVRAIREMKPKREKKVETVATSEPEEEQDQDPDEVEDRTAYVKEQYRLQDSFLKPFAVWLIKNHKTWFMEDYMNRVIKVDRSEGQLKSYLGAYPDGSSSYGFPVDGETYYAKLYDNRIVISHFTDGGTVVVDGTAEWFYLAASIQAQWNVVALEEAQQERRVKEDSGPGLFNTDPTSCPHRNEYSCTIPFGNRTVPGNGNNCGSSCCWSCKFHGACKLECNASAGRDGTFPEYDAAWFVNEWGKREPEELQGVLKECKEQKNNADRAKAVQKYLAPYGYHGTGCAEYNFTFHGFAGGVDLKIGKVETHLKYGRFVQELMNLYPDFKETVSKESENVIEESGSVPEQSESVPESSESVIDGVYEEVLSEQEAPDYSPRYFLEEQKDKLDNYLRISKGKELLPADIKTIECQKTIVAALACMVAELEKPEPEPENVKQDQPELPILKNNDQRAAFIDAYETWPIWIETKETGERYYRYDLSNGTSMVVKVYHAQLFDYKATGKKYEDRYYEGYGKHEYYYLKEGEFFRDCETNRSYLIERLKELQKKVKGD